MNISSRFKITAINQQLNAHFTIYAIATVLIVLLAGFFFLVNPEIEKVRSFGALSLEQSRHQRDQVTESLRLVRSTVAAYQVLNAQDIAKLQAVLPSSADLPAMFVEVEALALSSGLRLSNVSFLQAAAQRKAAAGTTASAKPSVLAGIQQMQVNFTVTGGHGYANLKNFLATLESSVRILDVQSLSYTPAKAGDEESYVVNAIAYYKGP